MEHELHVSLAQIRGSVGVLTDEEKILCWENQSSIGDADGSCMGEEIIDSDITRVITRVRALPAINRGTDRTASER